MTGVRRVAILFEFESLHGGEHSMLSVLERLDRSEFEVTALAPAEGPLAQALHTLGVGHVPWDVRGSDGRRMPNQKLFDDLKATLARIRPDLLHANSLSMGRLTGAFAGELDVPCTAHLRDIIRLRPAAVGDLNRNRLLIAVSNATRNFHVSQGLSAERTLVVYNGVDCDRFQPRTATGDLKRELGLPSDAFLVLTVGQIGLRKGLDVLAEAAVLAATRLPHAHYLVVGKRYSAKAESVAFEENIAGRFAQAGLADRLHRLGCRDDVPRLMNEADLLVHAAKQEPLGRVLLEAAASGLPIVATDVGGTREIVEHDVSAHLVPANDPQSLAEAILACAHAPDLRQRLSASARRRVCASFNIDTAAARLADIWRGVLATGPADPASDHA